MPANETAELMGAWDVGQDHQPCARCWGELAASLSCPAGNEVRSGAVVAVFASCCRVRALPLWLCPP